MFDKTKEGKLSFDLPKNQSSEIKVIGVGGGGSNAVNYMFHQGIKGVDFVVCNTDAQALSDSPVPNKVQLGVTLTEGLGAGANPEVGEKSAVESLEDVNGILSKGTKMVFITAGMGGGTGTGAAPIIAKAARELNILTVGIVTMPFLFEGLGRKKSAEAGVDALRQNVDSLIVINNDKLRDVYGNLGFKAGFGKANEVLATAARGIAEVITQHYRMNIDLNDAKTVLSNSGTAIMGSAESTGENRALEAVRKALDSPLLNDNHIVGAKNVLLLIISGTEEITFDEIGEINDYIQSEAGGAANIIMGVGEDEELNEKISVTVIATGFDAGKQVKIVPVPPKKIVHSLDDQDQKVSNATPVDKVVIEAPKEDTPTAQQIEPEVRNEQPSAPSQPTLRFELTEEVEEPEPEMKKPETPKMEAPKQEIAQENKVVHQLYDEEEEELQTPAPEANKQEIQVEEKAEEQVEEPQLKRSSMRFEPSEPMQPSQPVQPEASASQPEVPSNEVEVDVEEEENEEKSSNPLIQAQIQRAADRQARLKAFNYRLKNLQNGAGSMENEPAYKRMGVDLDDVQHSSKNPISRYTLDDDNNELRSGNSFLHDNVD